MTALFGRFPRDLLKVVCGMLGSVIIDPASSSQAAEAYKLNPPDKYHITAEERAACSTDALTLCSSAYPDEDKLLACMKINRVNLSSSCRPIFDEGIKRRHL